MNSTIELKPPFIPYLITNSYRYFENDEKHVKRICDYFVLIFMLKNELYFREDGKDIIVKSGEWYLQAPNLLQEGNYGCPSPEYYYLHFVLLDNKALLSNSEFTSSVQIQPSVHLPTRGEFSPTSFVKQFDKLEKLSSKPIDELEKQIIFKEIMKHLLDSISVVKSQTETLADNIIDYINMNYGTMPNCKVLKDVFHYSDDHISNIVKKYYGITPWQYVQKLRIESAMEQLTNTNYSVKMIANSVGYKDLSVFHKAFKQQTNMSPNKWRSSSRYV